jgi:thioredoxin 1
MLMARIVEGAPVFVDAASWQSLLSQASGPLLLDAYADWCGPCRMLAPELETVARQTAGQMTVAKLDVEQNRILAAKLGVRGIPALFLFKDGQVVDSWTGYQPADAILDRVRPHLAND